MFIRIDSATKFSFCGGPARAAEADGTDEDDSAIYEYLVIENPHGSNLSLKECVERHYNTGECVFTPARLLVPLKNKQPIENIFHGPTCDSIFSQRTDTRDARKMPLFSSDTIQMLLNRNFDETIDTEQIKFTTNPNVNVPSVEMERGGGSGVDESNIKDDTINKLKPKMKVSDLLKIHLEFAYYCGDDRTDDNVCIFTFIHVSMAQPSNIVDYIYWSFQVDGSSYTWPRAASRSRPLLIHKNRGMKFEEHFFSTANVDNYQKCDYESKFPRLITKHGATWDGGNWSGHYITTPFTCRPCQHRQQQVSHNYFVHAINGTISTRGVPLIFRTLLLFFTPSQFEIFNFYL